MEPQRLTDVTARLAAPVFDTVTVLDEELLLVIAPKFIEVGETDMLGFPLGAAA